MPDDSLRARFEEKLERSGGKQRWTGSTNNIGYPKMKVDGEMVLGSHVALRLAGRKVPTGGPAGGKIVMHKDNDKLNLAPSNLEVGTHKANLKQMRDEGRDRPRGVLQEPDVREVDGEKVSSRLRDAVSFAEEAIGRLGKKYTMRLAGEPVGHMTVYSPARWDKPGIGDVAANVVGSTQIDPKFHGMGLGKKLYGEVMRRQPGGLLASDNDVSGEAARVWQGMPRRKYRLRVAPDLTRSGKKDGFSSSGRYGRPFEAQLPAAALQATKTAPSDVDILKYAFRLQGHTEHQGIPIAIENRKGSVRKGVGKDGKPWRTVMKLPYGYIKGSTGADGEGIDCYVGPEKDAPNAYVVHQRKSDGTGYDEDKVMLGLKSKDEAKKKFLQHYNSDKFLGPVKEVPVERLKEMLSEGKKLEKISYLCGRILRRG